MAGAGRVRTVLGDVEPADLGVTMSHEHLLMTGGWPVRQEPDFRLDSVDAAVSEVRSYQAAGGRSLVEMTPFGFGRSARGLAEVARRTGAHVVGCTGFHKLSYYADTHWLHRYTVEQIAGLLVDEIETGMDEHGLEGPLVDRTDARAGVVKLATEYHRAGATVARLAEAIGIAHRRTGVPVATHTQQGTMGAAQLDLLEAAGVPASSVVLGHIDHNPDVGALAELASRGAYLACDLPGRTKYAPDSTSIALLTGLAERGHADRLLLAGDMARRSYWPSLGGGPGLAYVQAVFVPRLVREGYADIARAAMATNPARAFGFRVVDDPS